MAVFVEVDAVTGEPRGVVVHGRKAFQQIHDPDARQSGGSLEDATVGPVQWVLLEAIGQPREDHYQAGETVFLLKFRQQGEPGTNRGLPAQDMGGVPLLVLCG